MNSNIKKTGVQEFLELSGSVPVIDVRSPSEYKKGHIPAAVNIPLFSDDERAIVGTAYKQENPMAAIIRGLDIAGPKMSGLLKEATRLAGKRKGLLVYCWRGGRRSESMAWLFGNAGIECHILEGGYKAYRAHILKELSKPRKMIVLGGLTGSGKTDILAILAEKGEQVTDLEKLACHKGSAFGALGQQEQPGSEHFANLLYDNLRQQDPAKRMFLEDESHNIGSVNMPDGFFRLIRQSRVIALMPGIKERMPRLKREYGVFSAAQLAASVSKISKKLGGYNTGRVIGSIYEGELEPAIEIVLKYYDKAYRYGLSQRPADSVVFVESPAADPAVNALKVLKEARKIMP